MNTKPQIFSDKEDQLTLELLQAIENKDDISQRHLAQQMGVALGLANSYLKRCAKKGLIKVTTAPANRYLYYLTPTGFAEKARLTSEFLSTSLALFRQSGQVYDQVLSDCWSQGYKRVLFAGISDLTEIAYTRSLQSDVELVGVFQPAAERVEFFDVAVFPNLESCAEFDVVVMTSMEQTTDLVSLLHTLIAHDKVIIPSLLLNMQYRQGAS